MQNDNSKLKILRKKYPKFIYKKYSYRISKNNLEIFFDFEIQPNIHFKPKTIIENIDGSQIKKVGDSVLNNLVFHLGLMEIPSYWKATCSPKIEIKAGYLNREQIKWWKDLIMKGMGQFFYENKINFIQPNFLKINVNFTNQAMTELVKLGENNKRILVPVGGGKDSVVTLEILKQAKKNLRCFCLNPTLAAQKIMKLAGCKTPIIVMRKIDPKLLELNRRGFLNGHTPFSAYLGFLSILVAVLFNCKYVAFSNERSSNEGNVRYLGKAINHQWSKSFEFEEKFRKYSKKYLTPGLRLAEAGYGHAKAGVEYFSFLRPLYEIQIAKLFSKHPEYFSVFLSCNVAYQTASGTKKSTKNWCGNCPKCLFVFAILYPFVNEKNLLKIFKKNLFEEKNLLSLMRQLIGEEKFKPFECVGTEKENQIAFYLSWKKYKTNGRRAPFKLPFLLKYFEEKILPKGAQPKAGRVAGGWRPNSAKESKRILIDWNNRHNLSREFEKILRFVLF